MANQPIPVVFTPDNEPYLGRTLLFHFDRVISQVLHDNALIAPRSRARTLTDSQAMASQVIPQAISIALSIRELVRQGYLFGAHVLLRPLAERSAILLYIDIIPEKIAAWNRGWLHGEAPSLAKMFDAIQAEWGQASRIPGKDLTASMNSLLHGRPDSAWWSLIPLADESIGHAPSKILNRPDLCDDICADVIPWLAVVQAMMNAYFPD